MGGTVKMARVCDRYGVGARKANLWKIRKGEEARLIFQRFILSKK